MQNRTGALSCQMDCLWGAPFTGVTDPAPLIWLQQMQDTNPQLTW